MPSEYETEPTGGTLNDGDRHRAEQQAAKRETWGERQELFDPIVELLLIL